MPGLRGRQQVSNIWHGFTQMFAMLLGSKSKEICFLKLLDWKLPVFLSLD